MKQETFIIPNNLIKIIILYIFYKVNCHLLLKIVFLHDKIMVFIVENAIWKKKERKGYVFRKEFELNFKII